MKRTYKVLEMSLQGDDGLVHVGTTRSRRSVQAMLGKLFHPHCGTRLYIAVVDEVPTCVFCIDMASTW